MLVTFQTFLDKQNKINLILHAYLKDKKVEMTITLVFPTPFYEYHEEKLIANVSVSIINSEIIPKHKYDSADYEKTITLNSYDIVERVCLIF